MRKFNKIIVGIFRGANKEDLEKVFFSVGKVKSIEIIKGDAIIEMSTNEEGERAEKEIFNPKNSYLFYRNRRTNRIKIKKELTLTEEKEELFRLYYPNGYYKDKELDENLFDKIADKVAEQFKGFISFNKIRQYYDEVNRLYYLMRASKENKEKVEIKLKMLIAKAVFDFGRTGQNLVPENFVYFLKINEKLVNEDLERNLKIFKKHFEAIIAYGKGKGYFKA